MYGQHREFAGALFSFCDILRLFAKGRERDIVEFTVLLTGKTAGPPGSHVV
jgi:hypothetical protein